jgi:hypothetical protein
MRPDYARDRTRRIVKTIVKILIFAPIAIFIFGEVVLHLWNWLIPALFHLSAITFWQALGILVLSWILFGGMRGAGRGCRGNWRRRMHERWEQMTPEEREKFFEFMRSHGGAATAEAQPKP